MPRFDREHATHVLFEVGVVLKGIDGVLEIVGAVLLSLLPTWKITQWVFALTRDELSEDPHDFVASHLLAAAKHMSVGQQTFVGLYLLSHGLIKVLLVWALLTRRLWAYPVAIAVFFAFAGYQMYRYTYTHSLSMIALTVLDGFVIVLTWMEYRRLERGGTAGASS